MGIDSIVVDGGPGMVFVAASLVGLFSLAGGLLGCGAVLLLRNLWGLREERLRKRLEQVQLPKVRN